MSGRDRERERERERERDRRAQASARTNEYFVPKDGIDREVITADICRYLGNDALVRPGNYENPQTRQIQQGYFITAYRNLTTAMIADLKADSERWDAERRATALGGRPSNVEYRASTTHQSRQYYGPTEATPVSAPAYPGVAAGAGVQQGVYDSGNQYQQQQYTQPQSGSYIQPQQAYPIAQDTNANYYVAGGDLRSDMSGRAGRVPVSQAQSGAIPRGDQYSSTTPTYPQPDVRNTYNPYSPQPPVSTAQYAQQQPTDPYYGRAVPVAGAPYDSADYNDGTRAYQDTSAFSQPPMSSAPSTTSTSGPSSRRDRDRDSDRDRHHRSGGSRRN